MEDGNNFGTRSLNQDIIKLHQNGVAPGTKHYWDKVSKTYKDENGTVRNRSLQERIEIGFQDLLEDLYLKKDSNTDKGLLDLLRGSLNENLKNKLFEKLGKDKVYPNFDEPPQK